MKNTVGNGHAHSAVVSAGDGLCLVSERSFPRKDISANGRLNTAYMEVQSFFISMARLFLGRETRVNRLLFV